MFLPKVSLGNRVSLLCSHSSQRLDKATNKDQSMTILASSGLNDEDIQRMVNDAEQFAEADKSRRAIIEEAYRAQALCTDTEKGVELKLWNWIHCWTSLFIAIAEYQAQLSDSDREQVIKLTKELRHMAQLGLSPDSTIEVESLRSKIDEVRTASLSLFRGVWVIFACCLQLLSIIHKVYQKGSDKPNTQDN